MVGNGFHAIAAPRVPALDTPLENPIDFDFLADGRVVLASYHDPRVLVLGDDGALQVLAGSGRGRGRGRRRRGRRRARDRGAVHPARRDRDRPGRYDLRLGQPRAIACDGSRAASVTTVAGTGETGLTGDGGPGTAAGLHWPTALELDPDGNLFIVDTFNHVVRRLAIDGTITTVAGTGTEGMAGDGGPAVAAQLRQPFGVALDDDGTLYIGDRGNFRVRRVTPDGVIDTLAGTGVEGAGGDDGPATAATFGYVARVALDGDRLLVADQSNARVRSVILR